MTIERVSIGSDGTQTDGSGNLPALSADGRYVVFWSYAPALGSNPDGDLFVRDLQQGTTTLVALDSNGQHFGFDVGAGGTSSISADGRYIAFAAWVDPGPEIYIRDEQAGTTNLVSIQPDGQSFPPDAFAGGPSLSADGKWLAFYASSEGIYQVYVRDLQSGATELVSSDQNGLPGNANAMEFAGMSADGRHVAFVSAATNLLPGYDDGSSHLYVRDLQTGTLIGVPGSLDSSTSFFSLSEDGRYVVFDSGSSDLVVGDTNGATDVFVYDTVTGVTQRVSVDSNGAQADGDSVFPTISGDGRYIVYESFADNLVSGDTNLSKDIFIHDMQTGETNRLSVAEDGSQANGDSFSANISSDGSHVAFVSSASNLVQGDTNGTQDVFVVDLNPAGGSLPQIDSLNSQVTGSISERTEATGSTAVDQVNGAIAFTDQDANDRPTASIDTEHQTVTWQDSSGHTYSPTSEEIAALQTAFQINADETNTNNGKIEWTYSIDDSELDFLGAGESLTITTPVVIDDHNGGTVTQNVVVTIEGSNDVPTASPTIAVAKGGETATGTILADVNDPDRNDRNALHVSAVNGATSNVDHAITGKYGKLTLHADGSYSYVANSKITIPSGQKYVQDRFSFDVSDGHGGVANSVLDVDVSNKSANLPSSNFTLSFSYGQSLGQNGQIEPGTITWMLTDKAGQLLFQGSGVATTDDAFPLPDGADLPIQVRTYPHNSHEHLAFDLENFVAGTHQIGILLHVGTPTGGTQGTSEVSSDSQGCLIVSGVNLLDQLQTDLIQLALANGASKVKNNLDNLAQWVNQNVACKITATDELSQPVLSITESQNTGTLASSESFQFDISRPIEKEVKVLYSVEDMTTGKTTTREAFIDPDHLATGAISVSSLFSKWSGPSKWADGTPDTAITKPALLGSISAGTYKSTYGAKLPNGPGDTYKIAIDGYEVLYGASSSNPKKDIWYFDSELQGSTDLSKEQFMFGGNETASFVLAGGPHQAVARSHALHTGIEETESHRLSLLGHELLGGDALHSV